MFPALVPRALPTRTLAVPAVSDGVTAVICVPDTTTIEVALVPSKVTVELPTNPVPAMVTGVPPEGGPLFGVTLVTVGAE